MSACRCKEPANEITRWEIFTIPLTESIDTSIQGSITEAANVCMLVHYYPIGEEWGIIDSEAVLCRLVHLLHYPIFHEVHWQGNQCYVVNVDILNSPLCNLEGILTISCNRLIVNFHDLEIRESASESREFKVISYIWRLHIIHIFILQASVTTFISPNTLILQPCPCMRWHIRL